MVCRSKTNKRSRLEFLSYAMKNLRGLASSRTIELPADDGWNHKNRYWVGFLNLDIFAFADSHGFTIYLDHELPQRGPTLGCKCFGQLALMELANHFYHSIQGCFLLFSFVGKSD